MSSALVFPDGRRVDLDAVVVVGRAPIAPDTSPGARSISLASRTVSKTHALIGHDETGVWLVDLHSSNGSEALADSGASQRAVPGERLVIPDGSHIRLGTDTIITIDSGPAAVDDDLDRTVVIRPSPPPAAATPAPALPPEPAVPEPPAPQPAAPVVAPPVNPAPAPPLYSPPPTQPPPPQPPPQVAEPTTTFAPVPGTPQPAAPGQHGFPSYGGPGAPGLAAAPPPKVATGRSVAHTIGAAIVLLWTAVGFANLRGWTPDAVLDAADGRPADFFFIPSRFLLEFFEFFSFLTLPESLSFLSRGADIGPVIAIVLAIVALIIPTRAVRWILVLLIAIPMFLLVGFIVTAISDSFDFFTDEIDRFLPWFVLPGIGSVLLLWPSSRSAPAPTPAHDVFYAPGQSPEPPFVGPGVPPLS